MELSVSFYTKGNYKKLIQKINKSNADYIHYDVMDGKFVENKNLPLAKLVKLLKISNKKNDIHLMVEKPLKYIDKITNNLADIITIHAEINNTEEYINAIKSKNIKVGIAINPTTDIHQLDNLFNKIDLVLLMGVNPGKSGQELQEEVLQKIKYIRKNSNCKISIDGGINEKNISKTKDFDIVVSCSYLLNNLEKIDKIKNLLN